MSIVGDLLRPEQGSIEDPISYARFIQDRNAFRRSGTNGGIEDGLYDNPNTYFFKLLFYFWNGDADSPTNEPGGLLAPTWQLIGDRTDYYAHNSAWSFLMMNDEIERAQWLEKFVNILSNISTNTPWYFSSIGGLENALNREIVNQQNIQFSEERKTITITCLPDSFDNRISVLLDLYRSIVWSWERKCEVVPANLRKFDMGLYIFSAPVRNIHDKVSLFRDPGNVASLNSGSSNYRSSYKYVEFHNCEIDYNSSSTGWSDLNNAEGKELAYTITIRFDDAIELRYNEFDTTTFGDMVITDTMLVSAIQDTTDQKLIKELIARSEVYKGGILETATKEIGGTLVGLGKNLVNKVVLGNMYNFSLESGVSQVQGALQGHVMSTGRAIAQYARNQRAHATKFNAGDLGNIYKAKSLQSNI